MENKNTRLGLNLLMVVAGMVMMAYAAVPLYRLFCQETGFDGTPVIAKKASSQVTNRTITIRFNADTDPRLDWEFKPSQLSIKLKVGENGLAYYHAVNHSSHAVTGRAVYNVSPMKAAGYFNKVQCFCFTRQTIQPGQSVEFPVSFFVDPEFAKDHYMDDVDTITLSYTFYLADNAESGSK